ncbi:MAG: OmpA family protein [Sphingomonadaceae bacterium]|nr:OmpA family protein [Sphingomonadaceae bacterium]
MNISSLSILSRLCIATAILSLAACGEAQEDASPMPPETNIRDKADEAAEPSRSIIREEVDQGASQPQLTRLEVTISFADNGTQLDQAARQVLEQAISTPQMASGGPITLAGHTDSVGTDSANLRVSRQRAEAVQAYLVDAGIAERRITIIPLGEMRQAAPNAHPNGQPDEAGRAANRRVEMLVEPPPEADEQA